MTPREALHQLIREAAQAGAEFACDELRDDAGALPSEVVAVWSNRHAIADEIASIDVALDYDASDAYLTLLALVEQAERAAFTDDTQTTRMGELA